jgi:GNAT superfamily N-acetyltransferase
MARLLPGTALRVRRGRRHDLPQIRAVLGAPAVERLERVYRRILADLGTDVYVAEDTGGEIVGLVSVVYTRSLARGGLSALLDGARARCAPAGPLLEGLVAFAEDRARRRGCRRLAAWVDAGDAELRATLLARGYRAGELFVAELGGPS